MASAYKGPFTINNLPYGVISSKAHPKPVCATVYQDHAVNLDILYRQGLFDKILGPQANVFANETLNAFAALPSEVREAVRARVKDWLRSDAGKSKHTQALIPLSEITNHFPMDTRNFSDFYCSLEHTQNCSGIFDLKINPNWFAQPSVYNGRTSSLVISGTPITRPCGMYPDKRASINSTKSTTSGLIFQPESQFDFELEMGVFLSQPLARGQRVKIEKAPDHIFGFVLLNDWSARDIQFFEMQPLGPFHGKGAGTSISPWIVPIEALDAVACSRKQRQDPPPPPHLAFQDYEKATYNVHVEASVVRNGKMYKICDSNLNELHWTPFQQLTHLASAGEGLSTGDIFGTGTMSSPRINAAGEKTGLACLWERKLPHCTKLETAPPGIAETLLLDGDEVVLEAWCEHPQTKELLLGFGQCRGVVTPAIRS